MSSPKSSLRKSHAYDRYRPELYVFIWLHVSPAPFILFYSILKWTVYVNGLRSRYITFFLSSYRLFYDTTPPWPPNGYIMMVLILLGLIICHVSILFVSILQIVQFRVKKLNSSLMIRCTTLPLQITKSLLSTRHHIYASIHLTTDDKEALNKKVRFDTDSTTYTIGNSANAYIWDTRSNFVLGSLIRLGKYKDTGVATIGLVELSPHSIGDVKTNWKDDMGISYDTILRGTLFFPYSPVNLLSVTALAE